MEGINEEPFGVEIPLWFAMGAPYRNELKVQSQLEDYGIRCFIPMKTDVALRRGHKTRVRIPAVSNLLFARCSASRMKEVKPLIPKLQYKVCKNETGNTIITISDKEMDDFITVTSALDEESVVYYRPEELSLAKGTRVRIVDGGVFDGAEGVVMKVKGHRSKKFIVQIPGFISAVTTISPDLVEILK